MPNSARKKGSSLHVALTLSTWGNMTPTKNEQIRDRLYLLNEWNLGEETS
jgi:hypothetical protein